MNNRIFKTPTEIENELDKSFVEICEELIEQGLSNTEIAIKLKLKHPSVINSVLYRKKLSEINRDDEYTVQVKNFLNQIPEKITYHHYELAFKTLHEISYKDYLYTKYIDEKLSQYELGALLGLPNRTVCNHLKIYGIKKDLSQARHDAMDKGLLNYGEMRVKSRKTSAKSLSNSNIQDWARELFKLTLYETITADENNGDLELIIGSNEWGILKDREVDIAIIIVNNSRDTFYKYSVEFNHVYWHDNNKLNDEKKAYRLKKRGWKHFIITNKPNMTYSPLEKQVQLITKEIIKDISGNII